MKPTSSHTSGNQQQHGKDSHENPGPSAAHPGKGSTGSASQQATERAKRGEPLPADKRSDRSPKQENL